ncbi:MAG: DUF1015 domain-containing protein [Clostridia bacterium]|nr:DUF1015 domain-containing protein [Clostridia bacterium]
MSNIGFSAADILLPDFEKIEGEKWAVVACDQFTSEPEYWEKAEAIVGDSPSALRLILPEVYLAETEARVPVINATMREYLDGVLSEHRDSMIYLERVQSDGKVRQGLIGKIDLETYDYKKGATSMVRATEGTVAERIPPRVAIRRDAALELPHVMVLIDDEQRTVIEPLAARKDAMKAAYDFDLMLGGGHVSAWLLGADEQARVLAALEVLAAPGAMKARYGVEAAPLVFAVGDGNHSLASAKAAYEEVKAALGAEAAKDHPARYALVELVNLHDTALEFEPIYRVLFGVDAKDVMSEFEKYAASLAGDAEEQKVLLVGAFDDREVAVKHPTSQLTVGTVGDFIDGYLKTHPRAFVDYIHGIESTRKLSSRADAIGFLFDGMTKNQLFKAVICDGALPRKTFSMGHAEDKRYYLECRKIK